MNADTPARRSLRERARTHPWLTGGTVLAVVGAVVVVLVWFQPQVLLYDSVVEEEFPTAAPAGGEDAGDAATVTEPEPDEAGPDETETDETEPDETEPDETEPDGPVELASGSFESRNRYTVTGLATVYQLEDGSRTLRLEDFSSTNGPDLYVYLAAADHADSDDELDQDVVDLGVLRGNVGDQNYDVPSDVDLAHHDTVVIWCLRFTTAFGAADLTAAP